ATASRTTASAATSGNSKSESCSATRFCSCVPSSAASAQAPPCAIATTAPRSTAESAASLQDPGLSRDHARSTVVPGRIVCVPRWAQGGGALRGVPLLSPSEDRPGGGPFRPAAVQQEGPPSPT